MPRYRVWVGLGSAVLLLAGIVVADQLVLPALVHSRPVVRMPSLVGLSLPQAIGLLREQGFVLQEVRYEASPSIPEGHIIRQVPYAGAEVRRGRRVYLTVSTGLRTVTMPELRGLPYREAQIRLLSQGLRLGQVSYEYSDSLASGIVLWQSIAAEKPVAAGTSVDLVVSQGPRPSVPVPSLVSLSLEEAEQLVQQAGLVLGQVTVVADPTFLPNTVIAQQPEAGQLVPPGTVVSVTVTR